MLNVRVGQYCKSVYIQSFRPDQDSSAKRTLGPPAESEPMTLHVHCSVPRFCD